MMGNTNSIVLISQDAVKPWTGCHHWRRFWHHDNFRFSVLTINHHFHRNDLPMHIPISHPGYPTTSLLDTPPPAWIVVTCHEYPVCLHPPSLIAGTTCTRHMGNIWRSAERAGHDLGLRRSIYIHRKMTPSTRAWGVTFALTTGK